MNENAQNFWASQYSYENFKGSSYLYSIWNDMNEPQIYSTPSLTMPANAIHMKADGRKFEHREFHNAYGALHQRSTFRGLLARDQSRLRPFVLTRSWFLGSQKYGAYWTGDNRAIASEAEGAMLMVLQNGNAGHPFGGGDVPAYFGMPTQDMWVSTYQLGAFFPFFRAHCAIENVVREPWLQTQRVQKAIRLAVNRRFDLIHYLYTSA